MSDVDPPVGAVTEAVARALAEDLGPLGDITAALLPAGAIECVGTNGPVPGGLRERGVARVCAIGRMQEPPLSWPRGQRPALGSLLCETHEPVMAVEG